MKPSTNLLGETVRFTPETLRLPRFLQEFSRITPETTLIIRAHWRENGRTWVTLQLVDTGTLIDNMWLEWVTVVKKGS